MDALKMTTLAKSWVNVPKQKTCKISPNLPFKLQILNNTNKEVKIDASDCSSIKYLEHIHLSIKLLSTERGKTSLVLTSPSLTISTLLMERKNDKSTKGYNFQIWPMMSVHFWGEPVVFNNKHGHWWLRINNSGSWPSNLIDWEITFYGTETIPQSVSA